MKIAILVSSLVLLNCGGVDDLHKKAKRGTKAERNNVENDLHGNWMSGCEKLDTGNSVIRTYVFEKGDVAKFISQFYSDQGCELKSHLSLTEGSYKAEERAYDEIDNDIGNPWLFSITFNKQEIRVDSVETSTKFNQENECKRTDWSNGLSIYVEDNRCKTGRFHPGEFFKVIFSIDDKKLLEYTQGGDHIRDYKNKNRGASHRAKHL